MSRSDGVDSWISKHEPAVREMCEALRGIIIDADPEMRETIKWGNPCYAKRGNICYLAATEQYVSLGFFNGASLADPDGLIEGTGKRMRHVKVRELADIDEERFGDWIREAISLAASQPSP